MSRPVDMIEEHLLKNIEHYNQRLAELKECDGVDSYEYRTLIEKRQSAIAELSDLSGFYP